MGNADYSGWFGINLYILILLGVTSLLYYILSPVISVDLISIGSSIITTVAGWIVNRRREYIRNLEELARTALERRDKEEVKYLERYSERVLKQSNLIYATFIYAAFSIIALIISSFTNPLNILSILAFAGFTLSIIAFIAFVISITYDIHRASATIRTVVERLLSEKT